jgi:hypothetical protein
MGHARDEGEVLCTPATIYISVHARYRERCDEIKIASRLHYHYIYANFTHFIGLQSSLLNHFLSSVFRFPALTPAGRTAVHLNILARIKEPQTRTYHAERGTGHGEAWFLARPPGMCLYQGSWVVWGQGSAASL